MFKYRASSRKDITSMKCLVCLVNFTIPADNNSENDSIASDIMTCCFDFQTVVCFPYLGGVIELGVTELVSCAAGVDYPIF